MTSRTIFCLNCGSSSRKIALYQVDKGSEKLLAEGAVERIPPEKFAAALEGLDLLVFTGGIGERSAVVRGAIGGGLAHLGVNLDINRNTASADTVSTEGSRCLVRVIRPNEDLMVARHTYEVLFA